MNHLFLNGVSIEIEYPTDQKVGEPRNWKDDKVCIYDSLGDVSEKEVNLIIDYLYNEGFILDRRTAYDVIKGNKSEEN